MKPIVNLLTNKYFSSYNTEFNNSNTNNIKYNFQFIHFSFNEFTSENFKNFIVNKFKLNTTYSILLKISNQNNLLFKMCGPQIGLVIKNEHDLNYYDKLYTAIMTRIESTIDNYNYIESIDAIEIMYSVLIPQPELTLKNISNLFLNKRLISIKETKRNFNQKLLPLTLDTSYFGIAVSFSDRLKYINIINSNIIVNKEKVFTINDSDKMFIYQPPTKKNKLIIVSKKIDTITYLREIYDLETGIEIKLIKDTIVSSDTNNYENIIFERTIDSVTLTIQNQKVIKVQILNKLSPIIYNKTQLKIDRNTQFGTFDLETFVDSDGVAKVYALGFVTNIDTNSNLFYLTDYENLDSHHLILKGIDAMLVNKYNNFIFYTHNLGHFDVVFLYNVLLNVNLKKGFDYYILKTTMKENIIIKLDIKINNKYPKENIRTKKSKTIKISLVDSLNLLNSNLDKLAKDFKVETKKGNFPHFFVTKKNLNYIGNKPDISYYNSISEKKYNEIKKNN